MPWVEFPQTRRLRGRHKTWAYFSLEGEPYTAEFDLSKIATTVMMDVLVRKLKSAPSPMVLILMIVFPPS
jgi:hypothetical protein